MVWGQNRLCCCVTAFPLIANWSSGSYSIPPISFPDGLLLSKPRSVFLVHGIQHHAEIAQLASSKPAQSPGQHSVLVLCHFPASQGWLRISMQSCADCPAFLELPVLKEHSTVLCTSASMQCRKGSRYLLCSHCAFVALLVHLCCVIVAEIIRECCIAAPNLATVLQSRTDTHTQSAEQILCSARFHDGISAAAGWSVKYSFCSVDRHF